MSDQILADPAVHYPQLRQLLGGYFHGDWPLEHDSWQGAVDEFLAEAPSSAVAEVIAELRELSEQGFDEAQTASLIDRLGGSVEPAAFGLDGAAWLDAVRARLTAS